MNAIKFIITIVIIILILFYEMRALREAINDVTRI